jgi:CheY-like chemotaxis protein
MSDQHSILIIDDSDTVLTRLKERLVAEGYNVITTMQTVGAARHLRHCELVIIDYHMPGIDGGAVVESLRGAIRGSNYKPLLYVYSSDRSIERKYEELGFDGAFTNKGDDESLIYQVSAAFRMAKLRGRKKASPA